MYLITLNDDFVSNGQRNQLKRIIPDIINTCPTTTKELPRGIVEVRDKTPGYLAAEIERARILGEVPFYDDGGGEVTEIPLTKRLDAVRRAAAVFRTDVGCAGNPIAVNTEGVQ